MKFLELKYDTRNSCSILKTRFDYIMKCSDINYQFKCVFMINSSDVQNFKRNSQN